MKKHRKIVIVVIIILLAAGVGLFFNNHIEKVKAEEEKAKIQQENKELIETAQSQVAGLYVNENKDALAEGLTKEQIAAATEQTEKVKDEQIKKTLIEEINDISFLFDTKTTINGLLLDGVLIDDVDESQAASMNKAFAKAKSINEAIANTFSPQVDEINAQMDTIKNANQKVMSLFTDFNAQTVNEDVTRDQYNDAKNSVDPIKNIHTKENLSSYLTKVDSILKEKEEKAKAEAEEKAKQEEQAKLAAAQAQNVSTTTSTQSAAATQSNSAQAAAPASLAEYIASSSTATKTNQIVAVVASGTSAAVSLFEKSGDTWNEVIKANGFVGQKGIGQAHEGSKRTPKGSYSLGFAFGTSNPGTKLPFRQITPNSYWISNVNDPQYNTWQERSSSDPADEHLQDYTAAYQYAIVINYNHGVGGGSAFFLHVSSGRPTLGCVAVPKSSMVQFMQRVQPGAYIINVNKQSEIANY